MNGSTEYINCEVKKWLLWDKNDETHSQVKNLYEKGDLESLEKIMYPRLKFGTAGIRGQMGPGFAHMNDLIIIQTSQGLAKYLSTVDADAKTNGVVIGFDNRYNSHRFANLTAASFLLHDIPVYLMSQICPTPFIPFSVVHLKLSAGIMITASHNPKDDNGYKVYWNNGAQILSPHDSGIQNFAIENQEPNPLVWNTENLCKNPNLKDPFKDVSSSYYSLLSKSMLNKELNSRSPIKIVFSAMHGVGHQYLVEAYNICGFKKIYPVTEQMDPDPDFPTVKFPNPEEPSSLKLSYATGDRHLCDVILAVDPDADRLAVAVRKNSGETWRVLNGNEIGALFGWWAWTRHVMTHKEFDANRAYMISSTVSSKILEAIAKKEGFNFVETLTGFKWMCNKADELIKSGNTVLFAFEEAIGFMNESYILDKDGISASMRMAELAAYLSSENSSITQKLDEIYKTYGFHASISSYFPCHDTHLIKSIFNRMRNYDCSNTYPTSVGNKYKIIHVRDLTTGYDSSTVDKKAVLPSSTRSEMITFKFENNCTLTFRTSGTEPKLKYYSEIRAKSDDTRSWTELKTELSDLLSCAVNDLIQPEQNGLKQK